MTLPGGETRALTGKVAAPDRIETDLPLAGVKPGAITLAVSRYGATTTTDVALTARGEASRLDRFTIH
ncbi:hypothetical protein LXJ58_33990, partial [Escherichia coli]|nr:hypothetical protein [Escherichia coli]